MWKLKSILWDLMWCDSVISALLGFVLFLIMFVTLPNFVLLDSKIHAQTADARFYFSPASQEFKKGCKYEAKIMIDPGSNASNAANIFVEYDPNEVEIIDSDNSMPGKQIKAGNAYEAYADNVVDDTIGEIRLTGFSIMYPVDGVKMFGAIEFRSKDTVSSVDFDIWFEGPGDTLDSNIAENNSSDDILGNVENARYTFVDGPCVEDTQSPQISPQDPGNYDVNVELDLPIEVRVCDNRQWDSGVDIDSVEVIIDGETYTNEDVDVFEVDGNPDCYDIVVDTPEDFPEEEAVSVTFKADDFKGNSASKTIIFNIPPESNECIEELYQNEEIIKECEQKVQACEERTSLGVLPQGGLEAMVEQENPAVNSLKSVPAVTTGLSLVSTLGFSLFELPYYLMQILIWFMNLIGIRKKGKPWGYVYDSVTKTPVPRAVVRLFSQGKLVESRVTDINGVFHMTPKHGIYTLIANKQDYKFPSTTISGENDGPRKNIYKGGPYEVKKDKAIVKLSVPLDPQQASTMKRFLRKSWSKIFSILNTLNPILLVIGIFISLVAYYFTKEPLNIVWVALNLVFLILHFYVRFLVKSKWGHVVDPTGKAMNGVEIGLYDETYGRLIDTRVTDEKGRYSFVVPGERYIIKPVTNNFIIADPVNESGYQVGQKTKDDILINQKVVVRRV
jgi:hypothetical protein